MFRSAPPLLPELIAASVWISPVDWIVVPSEYVSVRSRLSALTYPLVTDCP